MKSALRDFEFFKKVDEKKAKKIVELVVDISIHPFSGMSKPEPLKHDLAGKWSRRIDKANRLVYDVSGKKISIFQCRYHYES